MGQGTYVRGARVGREADRGSSGLVDMAMNLPPNFSDASLSARLWGAIGELEAEGGMDLILRYQEAGGSMADRRAGAAWLSERLPDVPEERLLICPGAQGALLALMTVLRKDGAPIAVEALTYPGFRSLAEHLAMPLAPVAIDREGLDPDSLERVCRTQNPSLLYCTPTLHNPTTATMSLERRKAVIAVARKYGVRIIEDDAYGKLSGGELPPLAALAPDIVHHVASLSKCLSPALRVAYVIVPDGRSAMRLAGAIRATTSMASPLGTAIATRWIDTGVAEEAVAAIRAETENRRALAIELLGEHGLVTGRNAFHAWLPLANGWSRGEFAARLRSVGVAVVPSDAFAPSQPPEAVRLGLGAAAGRDRLLRSLETVAELATQAPAMSSMVV